jgi:hypothetical protein
MVIAASLIWSELSNDDDCTEGPCPQDGPLIVGGSLLAVLFAIYLSAMVVLAVRYHRDNTRKD